jgi:hypothetical protein
MKEPIIKAMAIKELIIEIDDFLDDYENATELEYEDYINYLSDSVLLLERAQKELNNIICNVK